MLKFVFCIVSCRIMSCRAELCVVLCCVVAFRVGFLCSVRVKG